MFPLPPLHWAAALSLWAAALSLWAAALSLWAAALSLWAAALSLWAAALSLWAAALSLWAAALSLWAAALSLWAAALSLWAAALSLWAAALSLWAAALSLWAAALSLWAAALSLWAAALSLWAVASAGHVTLLAALLNRLQGYAIPPRILHPLEKVLLATIAAGPPLALLFILPFDVEKPGVLSTAYRLWAIVTSLFFVVWALVRLTTQVFRIVRRGPALHRERVTNVPLNEALRRDRWTWRVATAIPGNEALKLNTIRTQIAIPKANRPQQPLRIVHLSDLHLTGTLSKAFYRRAIDAALAERPDAFVLTGDLIEAEECFEWIDELFRPLAEAAPTWFVLGNHDAYLLRPEALVERLEHAGLVSLIGRRERVDLAGWRVELLGDSAPWFAGFPDPGDHLQESETEAVDLTLALMHTPDRWPAAKKLGADLALAGHTHGGQIRIPIFGPLFCPSRHGSRYSRGWFESHGKRMFVSQGVAGVIPVRFLCPPEVVRIDVLPAQANKSGDEADV